VEMMDLEAPDGKISALCDCAKGERGQK
jgi:hypothetical protein